MVMMRSVRLAMLLLGAVLIGFLALQNDWFGGWFGGREAALSGVEQTLPTLSVVPEFQLLDQTGAEVSEQSLRGRPWVASFIFTRCALSCPRMVSAIKQVEAKLPAASQVRQVSISVDPGYDTPEVLADYARANQVDGTDWLFLTGEFEQVRSLSINGFKLGLDSSEQAVAASADEPIIHSTRLVLVDRALTIRGYYDPFEEGGVDRLVSDIAILESANDG